MKRLVALALLAGMLSVPLAATISIDPLETSWDSIVDQAAGEGRFIYLAFLGDGWSVASKQFSESILETDSFAEFCSDRILYCPVMARTQPPLEKLEAARLQSLVIHFDIKSYPTVILLAPDGEEILRHGFRGIGIKEYLDLLNQILPAK